MLELMTWQGEYEGYAPRHMWLTEAGEDLALFFTGGRPSQYSHIDSPATIRRPWFKFAVFSRDRHLIQFYLFYFTQLKTRRLVSKCALVCSFLAGVQEGEEGRCVWARSTHDRLESRSGCL